MANTHTSDLRVTLTGNESGVADNGTRYTSDLNASHAATLSEGFAANQADVHYEAAGTLAASGTLDIDLSAALATRLGGTAVFAGIKRVVVRNKSTTAGVVLQLGAGTNPVASIWAAAGDAMKIGPSGVLAWDSPIDDFAVAAGSADVLRITNLSSDTSCAYEIFVIGVSA